MKSIITSHTYNAGSSGLQFCLNNPLILQKILYFSIRKELHLLHHRQLRPARLFAICPKFESYSWSGRKETEQSRHDRRRKETEGRKDGKESRAGKIDGGGRPREGPTWPPGNLLSSPPH